MKDELPRRFQIVREYSAASLRLAASRHNLTTHELAARILRSIKSERAREIRDHPDIIDRNYNEQVLACNTLDEALGLIEADLQVFIARDVARAVELFRVPVDSNYLAHVASTLELELPDSQPGSTASIQAIVRAVPVAWTFSTGFCAMFSPQFEIDGYPIVEYHHDTDMVIGVGARLILGRVLKPVDEGIDMRTELSDDGVEEDTQILLETLNGGRLEAPIHPSTISQLPSGRHIIQTIVSLMQEFVLVHEYAHLLFGHARLGPSHQAEYQADLFASAVLSLPMYENLYQETWFATALLFLLLDVQTLGQEFPSHPKAIDRFNMLADRTGHGDEFRTVFRRLAASINSDLRRLINYETSI